MQARSWHCKHKNTKPDMLIWHMDSRITLTAVDTLMRSIFNLRFNDCHWNNVWDDALQHPTTKTSTCRTMKEEMLFLLRCGSQNNGDWKFTWMVFSLFRITLIPQRQSILFCLQMIHLFGANYFWSMDWAPLCHYHRPCNNWCQNPACCCAQDGSYCTNRELLWGKCCWKPC